MDIFRKYSEDEGVANHKENLCWIIRAANDIKNRRLGIGDGNTTTQSVSTSSVAEVIKIVLVRASRSFNAPLYVWFLQHARFY